MFRFTIRELVLLTVIIAICVTWTIDRNRQIKKQYDLREQLVLLASKCGVTFELRDDGEVIVKELPSGKKAP